MITKIINKAWLLSQQRLSKRFHENASNCASMQESILMDTLRKNSSTAYGEKFQFNKIRSYEEYSQSIPVIDDYSQIHGYVKDMMAGKYDVLFSGKPLFFETTSGSSSLAKFIPYNDKLKSEFKAAVAVWMWDLYQFDRQIFSGKAYWSLSPAMKEQGTTEAGIRIGVDNDADYFDPITSMLLRQVFAIPPHIQKIKDPSEFYLQSWKHLLASSNLSFISVWSPQFLLKLMDFFIDNFQEISKMANLPSTNIDIIKSAITEKNLTLELLFPSLRMISCWTNAQSAIWLNQLQKISGNIPIQGKGLLATEGVVSIPLGMNNHVLSYTSHFYEFKDDHGDVYTAEKIVEGVNYEVLITTGAGLYRYNTHDLVKCTGHYESVPCLEFLGRSGNVSDMTGEKLSENSITEVFLRAQERFHEIVALFLLPVKAENSGGYKLIIESTVSDNGKTICAFVEAQLSENPYYHQGLALGQLNKLIHLEVRKGFTQKLILYYQETKKIKDGDIKLPLLYPLGFLDNLIKQEGY